MNIPTVPGTELLLILTETDTELEEILALSGPGLEKILGFCCIWFGIVAVYVPYMCTLRFGIQKHQIVSGSRFLTCTLDTGLSSYYCTVHTRCIRL